MNGYYYYLTKQSMLFSEETNDKFNYYIGLPGFTKEDLDIKMLVEEKFLTILVVTKKSNTFVQENEEYRIVKVLEKVKANEKEISVDVTNGVLTISLPKSNPIKEFKL